MIIFRTFDLPSCHAHAEKLHWNTIDRHSAWISCSDRVSHYEFFTGGRMPERGNEKDKERNIRPTNELSLVTSIDKLFLSALWACVARTQSATRRACRGVV
jgi:hypothetical protein